MWSHSREFPGFLQICIHTLLLPHTYTDARFIFIGISLLTEFGLKALSIFRFCWLLKKLSDPYIGLPDSLQTILYGNYADFQMMKRR